jgi:hypothetical protein
MHRFGDRDFKVIIKAAGNHKDATYIQFDTCPYKKRHQCCYTQRKGHMRT